MKLLLTGFEPFAGGTVNPSWEAVKRLDDTVGRFTIEKLLLPVTFGGAARTVIARLEELRPDAILCVGQAGGRAAVTPELVAINLREASVPDNDGFMPAGEPVVPGGPAAYFSTLPVRKMTAAIREAGIPAALSLSAGAFVCNDVLYALLHRFNGTETKIAFVHLPFLPEQAGEDKPSLTLDEMTRALRAAIGVL